MPTLIHSIQQTESNLRVIGTFSAPGATAKDLVVISGYATSFDQEPTGNSDSDYKYEHYTCEMFVGPKWRSLFDVSPIVTISGFLHHSSDEADSTGYEIMSCIWEFPETAFQKIKLITGFKLRGGPDASITQLAYHLSALGNLDASVGNPIP